MKRVISTNANLERSAACLKQAGITHAVRYYASAGNPKAITKREADALAAVGIQVAVVYQERARAIGDFTLAKAQTHATNALASAKAIGQPAGSAIYFAVDYDATSSDLSGTIVQYFNEVNRTMANASGGRNPYHLGVYGSGRSCRYLKQQCPAVRYTWLSVSKGWAESRTYNGWDLNQVWGEGKLCGLTPVYIDSRGRLQDGDYEYNDDDGEFGAFVPGGAAPAILPAEVATGNRSQDGTAIARLDFAMELGTGSVLRTGILSLRDKNGKEIYSAEAVSGRAGDQDQASLWEKGVGPMPPGAQFQVETQAELPESNGHLGVRFRIEPHSVQSPSGVSRGGFSIHGPEPTPGSSGGISLLHENDFSTLRRLLAVAGKATLPLTLTYTGLSVPIAPQPASGQKGLGAVFSMRLKNTSTMLYGRFAITGPDGTVLYDEVATSGVARYQHPGAFWRVGLGVVPPTKDNRFIQTVVWANDAPMGTRYQITPERVTDGNGHFRSEFRVHVDSGAPGSAGCIVTPSRENYDRIIKIMKTLREAGIKEIPLKLNYT